MTHTLSGQKYQSSLSEEEKIAIIRNRHKEVDSLRKWDYFLLRNNPEEALTYYLKIAEKLPDDIVILKKIAHAYYLKKDWSNTYNTYARVRFSELSPSEQSEFLNALFFDESHLDRIGEMARMDLDSQQYDYYKMIDSCHTGIHNCIVSIDAYTWTHQDIIALQTLIHDAAKVSPDYQYRNFAVATQLYEYGDYRATSLLAQEILSNRPDYIWVEKLLGFALAEIGNTTDAKKYLLKYLENHVNDYEVMVRLGDIAFGNNDFRTAIIYYNNAIIAWYSPKTDIERKLAYSYSRLSDTAGMLRVLAYLLQEADATEDDAAVAISLALENGENLKAYIWSTDAAKRYQKSPIIAALYMTSMRLVGKPEDAMKYIESLPSEIRDAPIVLLENAILTLWRWEMESALALFERVRDIDNAADFSLEAQNYIEYILAQKPQTEYSWSNDSSSWWR
jgi:tetratricopeptide (TPR) repeat protein